MLLAIPQHDGRRVSPRSLENNMPCQCYIVPKKVLLRFSRDKKLSAARRKSFADAARFDDEWRKLRLAHTLLSSKARTLLAAAPPSVAPAVITGYYCNRS